MQVDEQQFTNSFSQGVYEALAILEKQAAPIIDLIGSMGKGFSISNLPVKHSGSALAKIAPKAPAGGPLRLGAGKSPLALGSGAAPKAIPQAAPKAVPIQKSSPLPATANDIGTFVRPGATASNLPAKASDYVQWASPAKPSLMDSFKNISPDTKLKAMQVGAGAGLAGAGYAAGHSRMKSKAEDTGIINRMRGNFS